MSAGRVNECFRRSKKRSSKLTWLNDIHRTILKEPLEIPTRVEPLAQRYGTSRQTIKLLDALRVFAKKRLFDEQRAMGL
jgi:hypothetical protein